VRLAFAMNPNAHQVDQAALAAQETKPGFSVTSLAKYILGQYRHFEIMEHYLHRPLYIREQFLFPLPKSVKQQLVELCVVR
jgi:hypothetical protein